MVEVGAKTQQPHCRWLALVTGPQQRQTWLRCARILINDHSKESIARSETGP